MSNVARALLSVTATDAPMWVSPGSDTEVRVELPTIWSEAVEETIVKGAHELLRK